MYRHVLIAVDSSAEADQVLAKGIALAKLWGAKVSVLHAMELPVPMVGEMALVDTYFNAEEYAKLVRDALTERVRQAGLALDSLHIEAGFPAAKVVSYAEQQGADLIVTGSHGKHGLSLLLGSVASGILHKTKCDVFVCRIH